VGANFEVPSDLLVCRCVEHADRPITVPDIDTFRGGVIAQLIGILGKLHRIDQLIGIGIEDLTRTITLIRNHDAVQVGKVRDHLWLDESFLHAAVSPATGCIHNFHAVVAVNGRKTRPPLLSRAI
jgi:hypothetical protein